MIIIKNSEQLKLMRIAGRITAEALIVAKDAIRPGMTTLELDTKIRRYIDPVTSEEGVPAKAGRSEKAQATVYQKHRSLQNRKVKYRG